MKWLILAWLAISLLAAVTLPWLDYPKTVVLHFRTRGSVLYVEPERSTVERPTACFVKHDLDQVEVQNDWACEPPPKTGDEAAALRERF